MIVDFLDVGQGSSSIIHVNSSEFIIIDTGDKDCALPQWLSLRTSKIKVKLVLTHWHQDHVGAAHQLSKIPCVSVEQIIVVPPHDVREETFQDFLRPYRSLAEKDSQFIVQATANYIIWSNNQFSLRIIYPRTSDIFFQSDVNNSSSIVALFYGEEKVITWTADNRLKTIKEFVGSEINGWITAPHHGAPTDVLSKKSKQRIKAQVEITPAHSVKPKAAYVSVGTNNKYSHPSIRLLRPWAKEMVRVVCSQLTRACSCSAVREKQSPVLIHASYGYPINHKGVACRGPLRLTWDGVQFLEDKHSLEHLAQVAKLSKPACLIPLAKYFNAPKEEVAELLASEIKIIS